MQLPEESPRASDAEIIELLLVKFSADLERIAWSILRDWSLAADAVQETFALLSQRLPEIPCDQRPGWLIKTVQFQAHNLRRKQQRANKLPEQLLASGRLQVAEGDLAGPQHAEQSEQLKRIWVAIDTLPERQRAIVLGRLRDDKTFAQLADELHLPLGTVLSRMRLALKKLRTKLDES